MLLADRLAQAILAARRADDSVALLLLDLDGFKEVNDTFGHDAGDELLRQVGSRLRAAVREIDTVGRLGGDEFAVVLPQAGVSAALLVAQKLLRTLERPFVIADQALDAVGSIGISVFPDHGSEPAPLLRHADIAMYVAKQAGAGQAVYAPEHDPHSPARLALTTSLRQAIDAGELVLHYQPIVTMATSGVGREAGVAPTRLSIEITESSAMAEPERTIATLARLERHGVVAAIDDFGTGYSSLAYLQRLPVRTVKIDRSFVSRVTQDAGSTAIIRATIDLAHALGLRVVAEGVEDAAVWDRLLGMGCDEAQGFLIWRPLPPAELEPWLDRNRER